MTDWADQVLRLAKDSAYVTSLCKFEGYYKATYIVGMNLLTDLFSQLFAIKALHNSKNKTLFIDLLYLKYYCLLNILLAFGVF